MLYMLLELEQQLKTLNVVYLYHRQCFVLATAVSILKEGLVDE